MEEVVNLINTVGFPIAMVVYFIYDKNKTTAEMMKQVTDCIKDMTETVTECINGNTKVMSAFCTKFHLTDNKEVEEN